MMAGASQSETLRVREGTTLTLPSHSDRFRPCSYSCGDMLMPRGRRNIVATVNLECRLDLKTIALHARNAEYNPKVISPARGIY